MLWFLDLDFGFSVEETHSFLDFRNSKGIRQLLSLQKLPRLLDLSGFLELLNSSTGDGLLGLLSL